MYAIVEYFELAKIALFFAFQLENPNDSANALSYTSSWKTDYLGVCSFNVHVMLLCEAL
jgi:hypothetical protein